MKLKTLFILIGVFLFLPIYGQGQKEDTIQAGLKKNVAYGTISVAIGVTTINYERMLGESKTKFITSYWLKAGFGNYYTIFGGYEGRYFTTGMTGLTGKNNRHFEFHIGLASIVENKKYARNYEAYVDGLANSEPQKSDYRIITPSVAIGYRFQKPDGKFIFRTGYGFPELLYSSVGFSF